MPSPYDASVRRVGRVGNRVGGIEEKIFSLERQEGELRKKMRDFEHWKWECEEEIKYIKEQLTALQQAL